MRRFATPILLFAALVVAACTTVTGTTPTCVSDVDDAGIKVGVDNGCTGYASCVDENGKGQPFSKCCVDGSGKPLTGGDLQLCMFAYGQSPPPSSGAGTTTGSGSGGGGGT